MDYRILVEPAAARRLETFLPYVVQGLARHLVELLEGLASDGAGLLASTGGARVFAIDVEGASVSCRIDGRDETLTILDVQERPGAVAPAAETAAATAPI
jgi:hypothetical protein